MYSWGLGKGGRLGNSDEANQFIPKQIEAFKDKKVHLIRCGVNDSIVVCS